jgi:hypothetical protein
MPVLSKELAAKNILELFAHYQSGKEIEPDEVAEVLGQWPAGEDMPKPVWLATAILAPLTAKYLPDGGSHEISAANWQALRPKEAKSGFHWALILKTIQDENPGISIDDAFLLALPYLLTEEERSIIDQAKAAVFLQRTSNKRDYVFGRFLRSLYGLQLGIVAASVFFNNWTGGYTWKDWKERPIFGVVCYGALLLYIAVGAWRSRRDIWPDVPKD